jgi:hypothetical protein
MRTCLARYGMRAWRAPVWRAVRKHVAEAGGRQKKIVGEARAARAAARVRPDFVIDDVKQLLEIAS